MSTFNLLFFINIFFFFCFYILNAINPVLRANGNGAMRVREGKVVLRLSCSLFVIPIRIERTTSWLRLSFDEEIRYVDQSH